ncbi:MAG: class I SAM-dependent methyltransferase [Chloroflexota bacterium]
MSFFWTKNAVKDVVRRHWSGRAATFDEGVTHAPQSPEQRAAWRERLQAWAGADAIDVLDVGCGTGFLALQLASLSHRASGADFSDAMLERARAKAEQQSLNVRFDTADAENLPYADASFDLVIERHVVWTLPDPTGALLEWRRVLRPGGRIILIEGLWSSPLRPRESIKSDYQAIHETLPLFDGATASELISVAETAGFSDAHSELLMDEQLWGGPVDRERYALHARKA